MKKQLIYFISKLLHFDAWIFTLLLILSFSNVQAQGPGTIKIHGQQIDVSKLNREIEYLMRESNIPGTSVAIIENGKVVFSNAYGVKDSSDAVNQNTLFEACSLSKSFMVYAVHKLVDEGKLDLDKPLYEYVENDRIKNDARSKLITARMVLSHSSGLENWQAMNNPDSLEILSNPGEKYIYSGEGYNYLAKVIEVILNKKYKVYIKELVLDPLHLTRTYTTFSEDLQNPVNYAIGHDQLGKPVDKWKNVEPNPAAGIQTIASDYANLVISIFDHENLSGKRINDLIKPVICLNEKESVAFYGPGFAIVYNGNDTLIYQGGDNEGFKACVFYSIVTKTGLVLMTNSDRGLVMTERLNQLSIKLNIKELLEKYEINKQYPNDVTYLLKIYKNEGVQRMTEELEKLKNSRTLQAHTLNELSYVFLQHDPELSVKFLQENIARSPNDGISYYILGIMSFAMEDYLAARDYFNKSKELNFIGIDNNFSVDLYLKKCNLKINGVEAHKTFKFNQRR